MAAPRIITSSAIIANVNVAVGMQDMNPNILSWSLRAKRSNPFMAPSLWVAWIRGSASGAIAAGNSGASRMLELRDRCALGP